MGKMYYKLMEKVNSIITHYNHAKYWKMKFKLQSNSVNGILRNYYVYKMKKMEAFNGASLGTRPNGGSHFEGIPKLPHGLKGIIISPHARIGSECTIFQQVTIGIKDYCHERDEVPIIGNNVMIGAGAKILGKIKIGNNVTIGANAVITKDIMDNKTVVGNNRIIS